MCLKKLFLPKPFIVLALVFIIASAGSHGADIPRTVTPLPMNSESQNVMPTMPAVGSPSQGSYPNTPSSESAQERKDKIVDNKVNTKVDGKVNTVMDAKVNNAVDKSTNKALDYPTNNVVGKKLSTPVDKKVNTTADNKINPALDNKLNTAVDQKVNKVVDKKVNDKINIGN